MPTTSRSPPPQGPRRRSQEVEGTPDPVRALTSAGRWDKPRSEHGAERRVETRCCSAPGIARQEVAIAGRRAGHATPLSGGTPPRLPQPLRRGGRIPTPLGAAERRPRLALRGRLPRSGSPPSGNGRRRSHGPPRSTPNPTRGDGDPGPETSGNPAGVGQNQRVRRASPPKHPRAGRAATHGVPGTDRAERESAPPENNRSDRVLTLAPGARRGDWTGGGSVLPSHERGSDIGPTWSPKPVGSRENDGRNPP